MQRPPAWLIDRIRGEIRRGIRLLRKEQALSDFEIDSIHFRLFLEGEWHGTSFDREGRVASEPQGKINEAL